MDSLIQQIFNTCLIYARHCINTGETIVRSDIVLVNQVYSLKDKTYNQVHQLSHREKKHGAKQVHLIWLGEEEKVAIREVPQKNYV